MTPSGTTNLPLFKLVKKSLPSKALMPSSWHMSSCPLDQQTDQQRLSISFIMSTANGMHLPGNQVLSSLTIRTWKSLLMTISAGQICLKRHCHTWNVNFASTRPANSHWVCNCIFSKHFEFVSIDVCPDRNWPATSKHQLLEHWPQPKLIRIFAMIVQFAQFYGKFVPQFELRIAPLCNLIIKLEYTKPVAPHWTTTTQDSFNNIKVAILPNPCLKHFEHNHLIKHLIVLWSDFSSKGFGYFVCQPGTDTALAVAMVAYRSGSDFSFMTKDSVAVLHPDTLGARRCCRNEVWLHSNLGEGFSSDWAMY